ncbi:hypothetical protein B0H16DRAFT_1461053 [Mycena metata]|uniref:Uncharacterized protein n=1 Tax=Mycena metata TaxID=1033252 RepID=A0AAD7ISN4_9AGAR|nr:hypothetical protein B0H16DRAFT_1461053 [Mycena metata]
MQFTTSLLLLALFAAVTRAATIPTREPDLEARCVCTPEGCFGAGCVGLPGGRDLEERCSGGSHRREPICPPTMNGSLMFVENAHRAVCDLNSTGVRGVEKI